VGATGQVTIQTTRGALVVNGAINTVATAVVNFVRDASVDPATIVGAGTVSTLLIDKANDAFYDDTAVGGKPAIVVAPMTPVAGGPSIQQAIDALKPYQRTFTNADLVAGILTVTHNLGQQFPSRCIVTDDNNNIIWPDLVHMTSAIQTEITLTSYIPIIGGLPGTWHVSMGI